MAIALIEANGRASVRAWGNITNRLNTTGRSIDLPVPLREGRRELGEITIRLNSDDSVLVHRDGLCDLARQTLNARVLDDIQRLPATFLSIEALAAAGIEIGFDASLLEVVVKPKADQRPISDLSFGDRPRQQASGRVADPANISGYVNIIGNLDWVWGGSNGSLLADDNLIGQLDLSSAVRFQGTVVESRSVYRTAQQALLCPNPQYCSVGIIEGLHRQQTRAVRDLPGAGMRIVAGDNDPLGLGMQAVPEFLGLSIEKAPAKLGDREAIRPTPKSTFQLDRRSDVEVRINGVTLHRLQLQAGTYSIRDLPIATGASEIELVIADETGATRVLRLSAYYDTRLLRPGGSEWALLAGLPSATYAEKRIYSEAGPLVSGFYRLGVSDEYTVEGHVQADQGAAMSGVGVIAQTPWGVAAFRAAVSHDDVDWGAAGAIDWSMTNFRGFDGNYGHSFRLSAEYRALQFHAPGAIAIPEHHLVAQSTGYRARFDAFYNFRPMPDLSATLSARYLKDPVLSWFGDALHNGEDIYSFDLTLTKPLTTASNIAVTIGYATQPRWPGLAEPSDREGELRAAVRFSIRPDPQSNASLTYDSLQQSASLSAYRYGDSSMGHWHVTVNAQQSRDSDTGLTAAAASLAGNRAEIAASHGTGFADGRYLGLDGKATQQRSSLRIGTAVAFADGAIAIGPPIRGGAFAIVNPHESIAGKEIVIGDAERPRARSDWLGPALVTDLPAYHPASLPVDVADLPIGYSLGAAAFDVFAPYKAGYRLEVGSSFSAYAYGTIFLANGEPAALSSGVARSAQFPDRIVTIFTNGSGRFGAEGLAPGNWTLEVATPGQPTLYEFAIPPGTNGLFDAGHLHPLRSR